MHPPVLRSVLPCMLALALAGCFSSGPYFQPVAIFPAGERYEPMLERFTAVYTFGAPPQEAGRVYFSAPGVVTREGVRIPPGSGRRLGDDGWGHDSWLRPIGRTGLWLQIATDYIDTSLWVISPKRHSRTEVVAFYSQDAQKNAAACAVTASGQYALVVEPNVTTLWDLVAQRATRVADEPMLASLRQTLATRRGYPGDWWMTNDTRYVVIAPSRDIHVAGGSTGSSDPMIATVGTVSLDLNRQGVIYDRHTRAARVFPLQLSSGDRRYDVCGLRPLGNPLALLYSSLGGHDLLVIDMEGKVLARHDFGMRNSNLAPAVWDQPGDKLVMLGRTGGIHIRIIGESATEAKLQPPPIYFVLVWDWRSDTTQRLALPSSDVRPAITG